MKRIQILLVISGLLLLSTCTEHKKKGVSQATEPVVLKDGQSVYGGSGNATSADSQEIQDEVLPTTSYGAIDSQVLDINAAQAAAASWNWEPVYFEFDSSNLTDEASARLKQYAEILKTQVRVNVLLEGHADTRGTEIYNIALGERRAETVKTFLRDLGVNEAQLTTISYGEMNPLIPAENEQAWSRNRRVAFTFK